jgi:hypothetical protein
MPLGRSSCLNFVTVNYIATLKEEELRDRAEKAEALAEAAEAENFLLQEAVINAEEEKELLLETNSEMEDQLEKYGVVSLTRKVGFSVVTP